MKSYQIKQTVAALNCTPLQEWHPTFDTKNEIGKSSVRLRKNRLPSSLIARQSEQGSFVSPLNTQ